MKLQPIPLLGILSLIATLPIQAGFTIKETDARITLKQDGQIVFHYNKAPTEESKKHESFYSRSGYIHPLFSPSGEVVTGDFAADHKHQHGLFFAWTKTKQGGIPLEFWNQKLKLGNVRFVKTLSRSADETSASIAVEHVFEDITTPEKPRPVLKEIWTITAHQASDKAFVFEIESKQNLVGSEPLLIEKYHYGGMALRGPASWLAETKAETPPASFLTSEGKTRLEGNHSRPNWVTLYGPGKKGTAGVAVYCHPDNFRAPQWVRLHPNKPYFVFAPMVEESFRIEEGTTYTSRYRYVTYDGEPNTALLESLNYDISKKTIP